MMKTSAEVGLSPRELPTTVEVLRECTPHERLQEFTDRTLHAPPFAVAHLAFGSPVRAVAIHPPARASPEACVGTVRTGGPLDAMLCQPDDTPANTGSFVLRPLGEARGG